MRLLKKTNIQFLSIRNAMYILSSLVIVAGLVAMVSKGLSFGIDFLGGTEVLVRFDKPVEIGQIRTALSSSSLGGVEIKTFGSDTEILVRTATQAEGTLIGDQIRTALQAGIADRTFEVLRQYKITAKVGEELRSDALSAIVWALIAILIYVGFRFKFIYGVGAVLALFHDVMVTLSVIAILNLFLPWFSLEITLEVVAAFLTIIGVSVNDTVVVMDRIRENEKIYRSMPFRDVLNKSLNDTLSRTIITNGTVFVVILVLLFFGGEVIRGFAFTLTIGTIAGTYSSIYIAAAVVHDWTFLRAAKK